MSLIRNHLGRAAILLLPLALGACAQYAQYGMTTNTARTGAGPYAWDGAGPNPNAAPQRHARNSDPKALPVAESEDGIGADADARLAQKLVICSTCIKPTATPSDHTDVAQAASR